MAHAGNGPLDWLREGHVFVGKYRIDRILGSGGMGVVVAAHHLALDEQVAIKFLLPDALSSPEAVARFAREARAAAKIKGAHIARVLDVGTSDTGLPYMVMEYLEGVDLSGWLREHASPPVELTVDLALQTCEAVAEAHARGIVHRDLKPANLFVTRSPDGQLSIKVLDFGISKVAGAATGNRGMTQTRASMGSPLYMSPEQMHSAGSVDGRTDIWALGVIVYEMLGGAVPFPGDTLPEVCARILTSAPAPLGSLRPGLPSDLEYAVHRCLEKDRERRFGSVAGLAEALAAFASDEGRRSARRAAAIAQGAGATAVLPAGSGETRLPATDTLTAMAPLPSVSTSPEAVASTVPGARRANRMRMALGGGTAILFVGAGAWLLGQGRGSSVDSTKGSAAAPSVSSSQAETAPSSAPLVIAPAASVPPASELIHTPVAAASGRSIETLPQLPRLSAKPKRMPVATTTTPAVGASTNAANAISTGAPQRCRVVSIFDSEGNQHFKQVCGEH